MRPGIFTCNMPYAWEGRNSPCSTDRGLSVNGVAPERELFDWIVWSPVPIVSLPWGEVFCGRNNQRVLRDSGTDPGDDSMKRINKKRFSRSGNAFTNRACTWDLCRLILLRKTSYGTGPTFENWWSGTLLLRQSPYVHHFAFECRKVSVWTVKNEHLKRWWAEESHPSRSVSSFVELWSLSSCLYGHCWAVFCISKQTWTISVLSGAVPWLHLPGWGLRVFSSVQCEGWFPGNSGRKSRSIRTEG